jgi:hypothetical protein
MPTGITLDEHLRPAASVTEILSNADVVMS